MRGILEHQASFMESFVNQTDVALFQISYTAMGELRRSTRSPLGEVRFFHQQCAQPSGSGFHRGPEACGTAANHQAIPDRRTIRDRLDCQISVHDL